MTGRLRQMLSECLMFARACLVVLLGFPILAQAALPGCLWVTDAGGTARQIDPATGAQLASIASFSATRAAMLDDGCNVWSVAADGVTLRQHAANGSLVSSENLTSSLTKNKKIQQLQLTRHPGSGYRTTLHDGAKLLRRELGTTAFTAFAGNTAPKDVATAADTGATGAGYWELTSGTLAYYGETGSAGIAYSLTGQIATPTQLIVDPILNHGWIGGADGILIVDLGNGQVVRKITLTKTVEALAWDNRNGLIWARTLQGTSGSGQNKTYTYAVAAYAANGSAPASIAVTTSATADAPTFAVLPTSHLALGTPSGLKLYTPQGTLQASYLSGKIKVLAAPMLVPRPQAQIVAPAGTTRAQDFEVQVQTRCAGNDCVLPAARLAAREAVYTIAASEILSGIQCGVPLTRAPDTLTLTGNWPNPCAIPDGSVAYNVTLNGRPLTGSEPAPSLHRLALSQSFTRDTTAPVIGNLSPVDGSVIKQDDPVVQLTGQTNDSAAITVLEQSATLNAQGQNPQTGTAFNWSITLQPGQNTAALTSLDPAGNAGQAQTTVTFIPTGTATWPFTVQTAGEYEITARWISQGTPTTVVYRIQHADGVTPVTRVPTGTGTASLNLGTYRFVANTPYAVTLDSKDGSGTQTADAVTATPGDAGYNIYPDQLGTPRLITDAAGQEVWRWALDDPYGSNPATGTLDMPLRFPGQYLDTESNLHYNVFRDYDPNAGRYVESDPIGLQGGIDTYSYALSNPLKYTDRKGLKVVECPPGLPDGTICDDGKGGSDDTPKCVTAECAAGLPPSKSENRTQDEIDQSQCELVCGIIWPGPLVPMSKVELISWGAGQASSYYGCKWLCKDPNRRKSFCQGR